MTLIEYYLKDMAAWSGKDRNACRSRWHTAAKRQCNYRWLTSDPIPVPTVRGVALDVMDKASETYPVTTLIHDTFFTRFSDAECMALYRLTKPRNPPSA